MVIRVASPIPLYVPWTVTNTVPDIARIFTPGSQDMGAAHSSERVISTMNKKLNRATSIVRRHQRHACGATLQRNFSSCKLVKLLGARGIENLRVVMRVDIAGQILR